MANHVETEKIYDKAMENLSSDTVSPGYLYLELLEIKNYVETQKNQVKWFFLEVCK